LGNNQLSGSIPAEQGNLSNLTSLRLSANQLSGSIPIELGNLTSLTSLSLRNNQLSGSIPAELGNLTNLTYLDLDYNQLSGSIPVELGNLTSLTTLDLGSNQLSGSIPAELGNLTNLTFLRLSNNQLSGSIPAELGNLTHLTCLELGMNQLSGFIPAELGNLTSLISLHFGENQLSGSIPSEIGNLLNLSFVHLGVNQLSGSIPEELCKLTNLNYLYLNINYLSTTVNSAELEAFLNDKNPSWVTTQGDPADLQLPVTLLSVTESEDPDANFTFHAELLDPLPAGHAVFLNFDNLEGNWLTNTDDGGHIEIPDQSGNTFSKDTSLEKLGIRFFRAAIFDTMGDSDPDNDIMVGSWSNTQTCTLPACLSMVSRPKNYGNPTITGSGSELFKNVDVAKGSYHLSKVDMSVSAKGPSFSFSRAYNSLHKSPWTFAYEMKAQFLGANHREIAIGPREDGHMQYFFKDMTDKWHALNPGDFDKLVENNVDAGFSLYTQGNRIYNFADPVDAKAGRLETIKDRLNNALTFTYDASNNLTGVADANSRVYSIVRDASNRISRVTDFSGRYVTYTYDSHNMITNVRKMRGDAFFDRYTYSSISPTFLQSISDARVYPDTQLDITYTSDPITNDLYRVHTLTNADGQTEFIYGSSAEWGVYTGISQPQVDGINHNRVYVLDAERVVKKYDAKSAADALASGDIVSTRTYKTAKDNSRFAELGLVTETNDPKNNNTLIDYNDTFGGGKPSQITDALGQNTQANYNTEVGVNLRPVTSVIQKAAGDGQTDLTTQYQNFISTGQAQLITDAEGSQTSRAFDAGHGLITQLTDTRNNVTQYSYGAYGNIIQTTQVVSTGNIVTARTYYNDNDPTSPGRLKTEVSPLGLVTTYTYDKHGNILSRNESKVADGINYTTYYEYDASDNLIKTTDPKDNITEYTYDNLNRKIQESYKVTINGTLETLTKNYAYDALGRLKTVTNERSQSDQTHYTARSQIEYMVNPLNETTVIYTYDKNGNVETVTDAENRVVTTTYDELNRKTRVTDNLGNYQEWFYNTAGQVASYRDGGGNISFYKYDKVGNLTRLTDPEGGITESTYDGNGNVLTVKDPNLHTTTYVYDELDRRVSTTLNINGQQWTYTYDANGNVISETTPTGEKTIKEYDALNRVTQLTEQAVDNSITRQISYTYDANNNLLSESSGANTISYTYDEINRVKSVTDQYGQAISYGYDKAGNRTMLTYPGNKIVSYSFDAADRLDSLTDWLGRTTIYTRNEAGQPLQVTYGNGTKVNYGYDSVGRLNLLQNLKADNSVISSHSMTLDGGGNITEANVTLPLQPVLPESISLLTYDDKNRIQTAGTKSYNHDQTGRIIEEDKDGTQTIYHFDIKDHITSITQGSSTLSSNTYDLNNNRISHVQNGSETRYVMDQLASLPNVVAETDNQGTVLHYYLYGEGLVSQIDANGASHYYHYDTTGHTLALSDGSGNVTDKYAYAPYGKTTREGSTHNPFLYVGKHGVMDDGNGLHYMRARYYKEDIRRFMSLDALHGEVLSSQSLNRYAYVLGNPVMGVDPSGHISTATNIGVGIAAATIETYMKNATDVIVTMTVEGGKMKYTLFRYKTATQKLINGSFSVITSGVFASMDTYQGCNGDVTSLECAKTIEKTMASTLTGLGAAFVCAPSGPYGILACSTTASLLTSEALDLLYEWAYKLGVKFHKLNYWARQRGIEGAEAFSDSIDDAASYLRGWGAYMNRCGVMGGKCD
jgi:RHS repeat-associated protein